MYKQNIYSMKKFIIELELTEDEIIFIKGINWKSKSPNCDYSDVKYIQPLEDRGVLVRYSDRDGCEEWLSLTNVGNEILKWI